MSLANQRVVIIGGSSGIGLAVAKASAERGAKVVIAGRSQRRLDEARAAVGGDVETHTLDFTREKMLILFFDRIGTFDHLVISAAQGVAGRFLELECDAVREAFEGKFMGQYMAARHGAPKIRGGGSVTFFSSLASVKAMPGLSAIAAMNGAVEALARTLAVELSPIRVNVVSPGVIDTPAHAWMPEEQRRAWFDGVAAMLPVRRVGRPEDVAHAVIYLMENAYTTGTILRVDGGNSIV
jgi:NAD(P)-dependent dehydrogenase (short-subunit alcohol dehydrogenase family)